MPQPREFATFLSARPREDRPLDLAFVVETLDGGAEQGWRVLGRAGELAVANAIFEAAMRDDPRASVVLRQGVTVLRRSLG